MANILQRFVKSTRGTDVQPHDYIPYISSIGDFKRIRNIDVILNSWNNILLTPLGSYIADPEFGSDLYKLIFEPADSGTVDAIKQEVQTRIENYDARGEILDIVVVLLPNGKGYNVNLQCEFKGERGEITVKFDDSTVPIDGQGARNV
jgi:phage baseplate assembly protein W